MAKKSKNRGSSKKTNALIGLAIYFVFFSAITSSVVIPDVLQKDVKKDEEVIVSEETITEGFGGQNRRHGQSCNTRTKKCLSWLQCNNGRCK